ncbi:MAG: SPOR domain-containing protein [Vibrio sp.]
MNKILLGIFAVIIAGVGISLSLPKLEPTRTASGSATITFDQKSESNPIPIVDFYLKTPLPEKAIFTLQLGMYPQRSQAQTFAETLPAGHHYLIVKITANQQFWYLVLQGRYPSQQKTALAQQALQADKISTSLRLLPKQLQK